MRNPREYSPGVTVVGYRDDNFPYLPPDIALKAVITSKHSTLGQYHRQDAQGRRFPATHTEQPQHAETGAWRTGGLLVVESRFVTRAS